VPQKSGFQVSVSGFDYFTSLGGAAPRGLHEKNLVRWGCGEKKWTPHGSPALTLTTA